MSTRTIRRVMKIVDDSDEVYTFKILFINVSHRGVYMVKTSETSWYLVRVDNNYDIIKSISKLRGNR